jgi:hypothetical protein
LSANCTAPEQETNSYGPAPLLERFAQDFDMHGNRAGLGHEHDDVGQGEWTCRVSWKHEKKTPCATFGNSFSHQQDDIASEVRLLHLNFQTESDRMRHCNTAYYWNKRRHTRYHWATLCVCLLGVFLPRPNHQMCDADIVVRSVCLSPPLAKIVNRSLKSIRIMDRSNQETLLHLR